MKFNDRHIEVGKRQVEEKLKPVLDTIAKEIIKKEKSEMNVHERKLEEDKVSEVEQKIKVYEKNDEEKKQLQGKTAARFSEGKIRHDLIPPWVIDEIAKVYTYGTIKYNDDNWRKGLTWKKNVIGPLQRHLNKWLRGEKIDTESNCHHLAMVIWQCIALMLYEKYSIGQDDRNPYDLDMLPREEQRKRIEKWCKMATEDKIDNYNGLDV